MTMQSLAFEIGVEEIPAFDLAHAVEQLEKLVPSALDGADIPYKEVSLYSSPRRLAFVVTDIPDETEAKVETYKGPAKKIAFDKEGNPTKAAEGFARSKGLTAGDLRSENIEGTEYVFATIETPARAVASLLPGVLDEIIRGISWPKSQRWGRQVEYFSRPVRWLVALFGSEIIDFSFAGVVASNKTYGHRFLAPGPFEIACAENLPEVIRSASVIPSQAERKALIYAGVQKIEETTQLRANIPQTTLIEVVNLVEYPTVLVGTFDEEFLAVPEEIIVDAMLMHQRYFPLYDANNALTNKFLVVSNGDPAYSDTIIDGNERVVRARLYDAKFFYDEDLKQPLSAYVDGLRKVVFQDKLGTMYDKTKRIETLVSHLGREAELSLQDSADALRAAHLCKADLVSGAVVEFTSVQGIMGAYYAKASGETPQVAEAIKEHYQPRFAGDKLPKTDVGKIVAMADKLDTICGLFAIGQGPTGSSDPFSLRRNAIGIIAMLFYGLPISLDKAIDTALVSFSNLEFNFEEVKQTIVDFFIVRTKVILREEGAMADSIEAVLDCKVVEPAEIALRVRALEQIRKAMPEVIENLATAFTRANNLCDVSVGIELAQEALSASEIALRNAIDKAANDVNSALSEHNYEGALQALAKLREPIDAFF